MAPYQGIILAVVGLTAAYSGYSVLTSTNAPSSLFVLNDDQRRSLRTTSSMIVTLERRARELWTIDPRSVAPRVSSDQCCVQCTFPANSNACCLSCSDVSSYREHDLLMAAMEGLTLHIMEKHGGEHDFLKNRAWTGNSHIGNRPGQATYYYDWVRSLRDARHVCEIGLNGGHSAIIFLASLAEFDDARITMFDLFGWKYSRTAADYVGTLYPGKATFIEGNSRKEVPKWTENNRDNLCDVFSVDGDHRHFAASADIRNAARATRRGGIVILDDMDPGTDTRRAFDEAVEEGVLVNPTCVESLTAKVGYVNRVDLTNAREMSMSWCTAYVP